MSRKRTRIRKPWRPRRRGSAVRNRPLDAHHGPFKRSPRIGPGPRSRLNREKQDWECEKVKPYVQRCTYVGPDRRKRGRLKVVKVDRAWKAAYNREYWDHLVGEARRTGGPKFANRRGGAGRRSREED